MKKIALLLAISIAATSLGCATTQTSSQGTWKTWPISTKMSSEVNAIIDDMSRGDLGAASSRLTPSLCSSDTTAEYLRAEIAALEGTIPTALDRFTSFIEAHPNDPLTPAAVSRLLMLVKVSPERLDIRRVSALRVQDPYAQARLIVLQNKSAVNASEIAEIPSSFAKSLTKWKWIGPFQGMQSNFHRDLPFDQDPILADRYEDHNNTLEAFRYADEQQMAMAAIRAGIYAAETSVSLDKPLDLMLVANSSNIYQIYIDGVLVLEHDIQEMGRNTTLSSTFKLSAGEHVIRLRLGLSPQSNAIRQMQIWLSPVKEFDSEGNATLSALHENDTLPSSLPNSKSISKLQRIDLEHILGSHEQSTDQMLKLWTASMMAISDGNASKAELLLLPWLKNNPDDRIAQYWNARRYLVDSDLDASTRSERAIDALKEVSNEAPQLSHAHLKLIQELTKQNQSKMALDVWMNHKNDLPDCAETSIIISKLARELEWSDVASQYIEKAAEQAPTSCGIVDSALRSRHLRNDFVSYQSLPEPTQECPSVIQFYAENAVDADLTFWKDKIHQLAAEEPNRKEYITQDLVYTLTSNSDEAVTRLIQYLDGVEKLYYNAPDRAVVNKFIDQLRYQGNGDHIIEVMNKLLKMYPGDEQIKSLAWNLMEELPLEGLRLDSHQIIEDYISQNRNDAGSSVLILDYAASIFTRTGAKIELTHQISRVLSKEGKIDVGEIYFPDGAVVLKARTIKDKTFETIEPESIEHKTSISAPNLAVGDYVEVEYITFTNAALVNGARAMSDAFFFGGANSPYVKSMFVYQYPTDWDMKVVKYDPEHVIQTSCQDYDGTTECVLLRENVPVVIREPLSPSIYDTIPNIMLYHNYDWDDVLTNLREIITRQTRITPYVKRYYDKIAISDGKSIWEHARMIFDFVMANINESESIKSTNDTATSTVTKGTGSRLMLLKALYDIAGIPNYFALIRSVMSPLNSNDLIALYNDTHATVLVVETEKGPAYIDAEDYLPFDYLSPDFQNQRVIPIDPDRTPFVSRTDSIDAIQSQIHLSYDLSEDGSASAQSKEIIRGSRGLKMRSFLNNTKNDPERTHLIIQNMIANSYGRIDLTRFEYEKLDNKQEPLELYYDFDIAYFASSSEDKLNIPTQIYAYNLVGQFAALPPAERHHPLMISSETTSQRILTMKAPKGYIWDAATVHDTDIATPFGKFSRHSHIENGILEMTESIEILPQRVETADYAAFRDFCLAVDEAQRTVLTAQKQ